MQFLHDNFESAEGASMPRSIIYNHYTRFCCRAAIEPMNPASFGKLVRLVFAGIKTRRLGTRSGLSVCLYSHWKLSNEFMIFGAETLAMRKAGIRRLPKCEHGGKCRDSVRQNIKQI